MTAMSVQQRFEAEGDKDPLDVLNTRPMTLSQRLKIFSESAVKDGTDLHLLYRNHILGNRGKSEFDFLGNAIAHEYGGDSGFLHATTEELYRFATEMLSYVMDRMDPDSFEDEMLEEMEYLIKTALAKVTNESAQNREEAALFDELLITVIQTETDTVSEMLDGGDLLGSATKTVKNAADIAGPVMNVINDSYNAFRKYKDDRQLLSMLFAETDTYVKILDFMTDNEGGHSLLATACENVKNEILNKLETRVKNFDSFKKEVLNSLGENITDFSIKAISDVIFDKYKMETVSGVVGGIMLGSEIGKLLTLNTGRHIDAKRDLLLLSTVNVYIRSSLQRAYDSSHPALYPLTLLWINCEETGLYSAEVYYDSYTGSIINQVFHRDEVETAKRGAEGTHEDQKELNEIRSALDIGIW